MTSKPSKTASGRRKGLRRLLLKSKGEQNKALAGKEASSDNAEGKKDPVALMATISNARTPKKPEDEKVCRREEEESARVAEVEKRGAPHPGNG